MESSREAVVAVGVIPPTTSRSFLQKEVSTQHGEENVTAHASARVVGAHAVTARVMLVRCELLIDTRYRLLTQFS